MINEFSPDFEQPRDLLRDSPLFSPDTGRFSGTEGAEGGPGGHPLAYDSEKRLLALDPSDSHTLVFGASGSKKTRAYIMPEIAVLGQAGESMVINDSKGELYDRFGDRLRQQGYRVLTLNLRNTALGNSWNPLAIPYRYFREGDRDKAAALANDVASTLTLSEISQKDPFFDYSAGDCCFGLIWTLFRYCSEFHQPEGSVNLGNLAALRRKLFAPGRESGKIRLWNWAREDELIEGSLSGTMTAAEDTMRSILAVLDQKLRCFLIQPSLIDMLSANDIEPERFGLEKTALFLITPDEKTTYHRLVALFVSQSYQYLIYRADKWGGRYPLRIEYILDEFSSLPAIGSDFPSMIAAARSRNIRFTIVCQSKHQLLKRYGEEAETIIANCTNWVFFFSRELELLRELSELCGQDREGRPNASVYDLQHLDKDKNQALLLAGRRRPAFVCFADADLFVRPGEPSAVVTPRRTPRNRLTFPEFEEKKEQTEARQQRLRQIREDLQAEAQLCPPEADARTRMEAHLRAEAQRKQQEAPAASEEERSQRHE